MFKFGQYGYFIDEGIQEIRYMTETVTDCLAAVLHDLDGDFLIRVQIDGHLNPKELWLVSHNT